MSDYCKEHGSKTENCDPDCDEVNDFPGMPRVLHTGHSKIVHGYTVYMCDELPKTGDTSYTLTDLVNKLVALSSRVVNDHGAYLNMNSGDDDLADMLAKAIAEIQGEGNGT